jgi:hypothetical protein
MARRQHETVLLAEILLDLRGHPSLSYWEEGFVASLMRQAAEQGKDFVPSRKQAAKLVELRDKVAGPAPPTDDGEDDDAPFDDPYDEGGL